MAKLALFSALAVIALMSGPSFAENDPQRAWFNYVLHCQGCHLADAMGTAGKVPRMNGFVGYFLHSEEGREFVVQVPGIATANLPDNELSELVNWMFFTFSEEQIPADFQPYDEAEVSRLRKHPETDPFARRGEILVNLAKTVPELACYSDEWVTVSECE